MQLLQLLIYVMTAMSAGLFFYGIFQLKFHKPEHEMPENIETSFFYKIIRPTIEILGGYNDRFWKEKFDKKYRKKLIISGNPLYLIPSEFFALKELGCVAGILMGLFLAVVLKAKLITILLLGIGCFFLPNLWLHEKIRKRKHDIFLELPFSMDLLTLAVEAGLTFITAIKKVVEKGRPGPLRDEFKKMLQDLRLGLNMKDALLGLAERTDMYEIRSFTTALIQADKLGSPLSEALRVQSEIRRMERFQRAEKMAQESPVKMLFPLLIFIFPAVFIVILTPILLKFLAEGM